MSSSNKRSVRFAAVEQSLHNDDDDSITQSDLLNAKRQRRSQDNDDNDNTRIDNTTSLTAESVDTKIEPFHMRQEESDGTGYFDGDTYVFRRDEDEEQDAWLEDLNERQQDNNSTTIAAIKISSSSKRSEYTNQAALDSLSDEALYAKLIPYVSDTETVMQAIARYGTQIKHYKKSAKTMHKDNSNKHDNNMAQTDSKSGELHSKLATQALNTLTEVSSSLLLRGNTNIYEKTRNSIMAQLTHNNSPIVLSATIKSSTQQQQQQRPMVQWEYLGKADNQVHGPYTTTQMVSWISQGYFTGSSAVQVRHIQDRETSNNKASLQDDLLADLEDDDDDSDEKKVQVEQVKSEWMPSDSVEFDKFA